MAGARVVEEVLKRAPDRFDIVTFGAEPYGNYNRILLSNVLNGSQAATEIFMNPLAWGPLADGVLGGGRIICPLHGHQFALDTGAGSEPGECLTVYPVQEVPGSIILTLAGPRA